jgi:hypothetical protein
MAKHPSQMTEEASRSVAILFYSRKFVLLAQGGKAEREGSGSPKRNGSAN